MGTNYEVSTFDSLLSNDHKNHLNPPPSSAIELYKTQEEEEEEGGKLISDDTRAILDVVFYVILSGVIAFFGSVANIINIIIFCKQGFNDTVNISLLGLAVSDLGALVTLVWMSMCFNPLFRYAGTPLDTDDVQYITAGWPHVCFARITSWITAFVTFERCLCIALPMKVKTIITVKRTIIVVVGIFFVMFLSVSPVFYSIHLGPKYFIEYNLTRTGLVYIAGGPDIENVSFSITVFAQLSSFVIVIICTVVLIQSLVVKSKWRRQTANVSVSGSKDAMSTRDKKVVIMVTFISCVFIVCFLPSAVNLILMIHFSPAYSAVGQYENAFKVSWSVLNTLEACNSSINIIIYFKMSSKFRVVFLEMFCPSRLQSDAPIKSEK